MLKVTSKSKEETLGLGAIFANLLRGGEVLALSGDLGSGKTIFTKGLARGLQIKKTITSPTFNIFKPYPLAKGKTLYHFDLYRISKPRELLELGLPEILKNKKNISVIEWPERAKKLFPKKTVWINFSHTKHQNERIIKLW